MGNTQSASTLTRTTGALDSFVAELAGDIVYEKRYVTICQTSRNDLSKVYFIEALDLRGFSRPSNVAIEMDIW